MIPKRGHGQRRLFITPELLSGMLCGACGGIALPPDVEIMHISHDPEGSRCYVMILQSAEWDELEEGNVIPKIDAPDYHA